MCFAIVVVDNRLTFTGLLPDKLARQLRETELELTTHQLAALRSAAFGYPNFRAGALPLTLGRFAGWIRSAHHDLAGNSGTSRGIRCVVRDAPQDAKDTGHRRESLKRICNPAMWLRHPASNVGGSQHAPPLAFSESE